MPEAREGIVVLAEMLDRERSCTVDVAERESRGGNMPSSEEVSSSSSSKIPLLVVGSVDVGFAR